jgi:hypothetical protein
MTRRELVLAAAVGPRPQPAAPLTVPVCRVMDKRAQCTPDELRRFWRGIWPEAVRDFQRGGLELQSSDAAGEIRRSPGGRPIFLGLSPGVINLVLTDQIPINWDRARALAGATTLYEGHCVCVIALRNAHGDQIPFLSVNTCVHEMLHALLQDIFTGPPAWWRGDEREVRVDWHATGMWLLHSGAAVRRSAEVCLRRLKAAGGIS